jgi:peroxiredoxin
MKTLILLTLTLSLFSVHSFALEPAATGKKAPDFSALDALGKPRKLADFKGKWVVMEWFNKDCPFVKKHYGAGNMQALQKKYTKKGVVWLTVLSSAEAKQGYMNGKETIAALKERDAAPTTALLDPKGEVGRAYGAKTTPHMYVINPEGVLVYEGAIDNMPTADKDDIKKAKNYVAAALDAGMNGKPIADASTQAYGCGVKY